MRLSALVAILAIAVSAGGCSLDLLTGGDKPEPRPVMYQTLGAVNVKVDKNAALTMISDYRRSKGLNTLRLDPQLVALAQEQADAMAAKGVMSHDVAGSFSSRLRRSGVKADSSAENIAAGYRTLADAFSGWRGSPGHNANMLLARATRFGIATANAPNSKYKVFWAMVVAGEPPQMAGPNTGGPMGLVIAR